MLRTLGARGDWRGRRRAGGLAHLSGVCPARAAVAAHALIGHVVCWADYRRGGGMGVASSLFVRGR